MIGQSHASRNKLDFAIFKPSDCFLAVGGVILSICDYRARVHAIKSRHISFRDRD